MTLADQLVRLRDDFAIIEDPQERLALIVARARKLPPINAAERTDAHRVPGCVSTVWLVAELRAGGLHLRADADSPLVRGLVALVCEFFSGAPPAEIAASDADPLAALGLVKNLSPTRQNGLAAVRTRIRTLALQATLTPLSPPSA